jgi:hypothetical protein
MFSKKVLIELAATGSSKLVIRFLDGLEVGWLDGEAWGDVFESCYAYLHATWRGEYVYKNTLALEFCRMQSQHADSAYTQEFRALTSIADVVMVGDTTVAYEIKSEYDSFDRLDCQLADYSKVFGKVNLVVPKSKLIEAFERAPDHVGIIELCDDMSLDMHRDAQDNTANTQNWCIFSCLRKAEYQHVIQDHFGELPASRQSSLWRKCQELFEALPVEVAQAYFTQALKVRFQTPHPGGRFGSVPSLWSLLLSSRFKLKQLDRLASILQSEVTHTRIPL